MPRILVTGGAGFLGSHLCDALLLRGWEVIAFDNLSQGSRENISDATRAGGFCFIEGDVRDAAALRSAARGVEAIAHLAAFKIPRYGNRLATLEVNVDGTRSALEAARASECPIVFTSTSDCYGKNPHLPFSEDGDSVYGPSAVARWAYAVSKLQGEHLCHAYREAYGLRATIVRIFSSYGPRQHLSWWGGPQSVFIDQALRGEPFEIHGDGKQTRSFTFVHDTIAGLMAVLHADSAATDGETFNVGADREITIADLAVLVAELVDPGLAPQFKFIPYRQISGQKYEDVRRRVPDATRLQRLGWRSQYSLEQGLAETVAWQRSVRLQAPLAAADAR